MPTQPVEVLLVEDTPADAELALHVLRRHHLGGEVLHLQDGRQALEFLQCVGEFRDRDPRHIPKLVLLDVKLPGLDGLGVLCAMKADPRMQEIPVVMLTSSRQDRDLDEAYRLGVNSYIVKPVEFDNFAETVAKVGSYWLLLNEPPPAATAP